MNTLHVTLGTRIKLARNTTKMTREKLAEKINVSTRFLADVESGKVGVSINTLYNICLALDVSADYLIGLGGNSHSKIEIIQKKLLKIDNKYYPTVISLLENLESIQ